MKPEKSTRKLRRIEPYVKARCLNCDRPLLSKKDIDEGMCSKCVRSMEKFLTEVGHGKLG